MVQIQQSYTNTDMCDLKDLLILPKKNEEEKYSSDHTTEASFIQLEVLPH